MSDFKWSQKKVENGLTIISKIAHPVDIFGVYST